MMISIIIATKNRLEQLQSCLSSIINTKYNHSYEILVCDQSDDGHRTLTGSIAYKHIMHILVNNGGKSVALNQGIQRSQGNILVFTDDDCIVSKTWLSNIEYTFHNNQDIIGVFGKTVPYQPQKNTGKVCPSIFNPSKKPYKITRPVEHWRHIGFGNNMAFRREIFKEIGFFKSWLGPGSIGSNAEDAEFALRALINKHKLFYNPNMIVYHNKWLTIKQMKKQQLSYTCGEMACYGYFAIQGHQFAKQIVWNNIEDSYYKIRRIIKKFLFFNWNKNLITDGKSAFVEILYRVRGLMVGWFYALIDPLRQWPLFIRNKKSRFLLPFLNSQNSFL